MDDEDQSAKVFASILLGALELELAQSPCGQDDVRMFRDGELIFKNGLRGQSILKILHGALLMLSVTAHISDEQKRQIFGNRQSYLGKKSAAKKLVSVEAWHGHVFARGNAIWGKFPSYKADRIADEIKKEGAPVGVSLPGHRSIADFLRSQGIGRRRRHVK